MSSPRVLGLLSILAGALVLVVGVPALVSVVQLSLVQPIAIAVGGGLVLIGVLALKTVPPVSRASSAISKAGPAK